MLIFWLIKWVAHYTYIIPLSNKILRYFTLIKEIVVRRMLITQTKTNVQPQQKW